MKTLRVGSRYGAVSLAVMAAFLVMASVVTWPGRLVGARADEPRASVKNATSDADAIRGIVEKYAKSIDDADTALGSEIWSRSPDVSFIHPRGHERGWQEVKRNFYEKTMGAMFSERKLTPRDVVVHVYGDAAWAEFCWDFAAKLKGNGATVKSKGRETQVFRKTDGRWALVHVHYSGMPVAGRREGF